MLEELVNLIGTDAAARLIEIFGGTRLYVPHSPHEDDLLSGSLGLEAAGVALDRGTPAARVSNVGWLLSSPRISAAPNNHQRGG